MVELKQSEEGRDRQTFKCEHGIVEGILVLLVCLRVVLLFVFVNCNLHEIDCTLKTNAVQSAQRVCHTVI